MATTITMDDLHTRLREVGLHARTLQHQFQTNFYNNCEETHYALRQHVMQVQLDLKTLEVEYALVEGEEQLESREGKKLAYLLAQVARDVKRAAWYEEDTLHVYEKMKDLENKLAAAELRASQFEERNRELNEKIVECENRWLVCTHSNLQLHDEVARLQEEARACPPGGLPKAEVDILRAELRKFMLCVARDSLSPQNMLHLLTDGDEAMRARALGVLLGHAKRAPLDLAHTDALCGALFQVACDHVKHAGQALSILARIAEANGLALFFRIGNLSGLVRRLCRDPEIRKIALPQLARMLRFLTARSGEGVLDTKEQRTDFARSITSIWKEVSSEGPVLFHVMEAVANLSEMDPKLFANAWAVDQLVQLLDGPEPCAPVLVALNNLCQINAVTITLLKRDTFLAAVIACLRGTDPGMRLLRQQACATLLRLAQDDITRKRVVEAQVFPGLYRMVQSDDQSEFDAAMQVITVLLQEQGFVQMVHMCTDFLIDVIVRLKDSDVAMELLATLFIRVCALKDDDPDPVKGAAEKHAWLLNALRVNLTLLDVVCAALYLPDNPARRLNAVKLLGTFSQSPVDLKRVSDQFLPSLCTFLRSNKTVEETTWGITVLTQLATAFEPLAFVQYPNVLLSLYRAMSHGSADAAGMLVLLTENTEAATFAAQNRVLRLTLLNIFARSTHDVVRDCAAHAAANLYSTGDYNDKLITDQNTDFMKAIADMVPFKPAYKGLNGASRLAKYMFEKDRAGKAAAVGNKKKQKKKK